MPVCEMFLVLFDSAWCILCDFLRYMLRNDLELGLCKISCTLLNKLRFLVVVRFLCFLVCTAALSLLDAIDILEEDVSFIEACTSAGFVSTFDP
ncbi:hypothetical protein [Anaplasma phagocytophilum]|uniref:hypothetical protein n=1 Tax=Anaplasma phagocytophilum TaxID=948 RepID=UPI0018B086A7|nr:hypothetical protein [Anaplasma phagocytophilum]